MNKKTIYRGSEGFSEQVKEVIQEAIHYGEPVHSDIDEGLRVYLYDGKQYNIYEDIENGVYNYITILW